MSQTERPDPLAEPEGYGSRIGRIEHLTRPAAAVGHERGATTRSYVTEVAGITPPDIVPDGGLNDGICAWYERVSGERCGRERQWQLITGDVAEHVCYLDLCDEHLVVVARVPRFWCTDCRQDMKLEKVGAASPAVIGRDVPGWHEGELIWLDESLWPVNLRPRKPPERLF